MICRSRSGVTNKSSNAPVSNSSLKLAVALKVRPSNKNNPNPACARYRSSQSALKMISTTMMNRHHPHFTIRADVEYCCTRLFCVGDDWQAIYRFAGSDISLMRNFAREFGYTDLHRLDRTFRYNNQINDLSSKFILKNPKQIPKSLTPNSSSDTVCVWIHRTKSPSDEVVHGILED